MPPDPGLLTAYCDGAARGNPGPAGYGAVLTDESGRVVAEIAEGIGVATNNVAEYRAAIAALERARDLGAQAPSAPLRQPAADPAAQGGVAREEPDAHPAAHRGTRAGSRSFDRVSFEHVPRERNKDADRLANRGVDEWLAANSYDAPAPDPDLFG